MFLSHIRWVLEVVLFYNLKVFFLLFFILPYNLYLSIYVLYIFIYMCIQMHIYINTIYSYFRFICLIQQVRSIICLELLLRLIRLVPPHAQKLLGSCIVNEIIRHVTSRDAECAKRPICMETAWLQTVSIALAHCSPSQICSGY